MLPSVPLCVDIELSAACNLRCPFCFIQSKEYRRPKSPFMNYDLARSILLEAVTLGVPSVKFNWRGEATMHPDFSKIISYAGELSVCGKRFLDILVNTNGNYPFHVSYGLMHATKVMFSVDSLNPETYAKMRKGGGLNKVINNISGLVELGHKNVWVRRVVTDDNRSEDFAAAARKIWSFGGKVAEHHVFERAGDQDVPPGRAYCGYPSQRLVISTEGRVYPCCVDYGETMCMGDMRVDGLAEIWQSAEMQMLRHTLKKGLKSAYPSACKSCTSWMAYDDPRRNMVSDKEIK